MVQARHQSMDNLVKVWTLVSMDSETSTVISWMLSIHDPFAIIPKFTVLVSDFVEGSWCGDGTDKTSIDGQSGESVDLGLHGL